MYLRPQRAGAVVGEGLSSREQGVGRRASPGLNRCTQPPARLRISAPEGALCHKHPLPPLSATGHRLMPARTSSLWRQPLAGDAGCCHSRPLVQASSQAQGKQQGLLAGHCLATCASPMWLQLSAPRQWHCAVPLARKRRMSRTNGCLPIPRPSRAALQHETLQLLAFDSKEVTGRQAGNLQLLPLAVKRWLVQLQLPTGRASGGGC